MIITLVVKVFVSSPFASSNITLLGGNLAFLFALALVLIVVDFVLSVKSRRAERRMAGVVWTVVIDFRRCLFGVICN